MIPDEEFWRAFFGLTLPNTEFRAITCAWPRCPAAAARQEHSERLSE